MSDSDQIPGLGNGTVNCQSVMEKPTNLELSNTCTDTSQCNKEQLPPEDGNGDTDLPDIEDVQHENVPIESPLSEECHVKQHHQSLPPKPDSQDNTSQGSMTDSGLCSDISPVPKCDEIPRFCGC